MLSVRLRTYRFRHDINALTGPMFLAPLAEAPPIGRKPVYLVTLLIFVLFNFAVVYAPNIGTLLAFRFLTVSG